ncbi:hypothetical protein MMC28_008334 [Mycoblastus sanguinarius]|nr:hypothetical protein [Mycoblastus sanguinarius]
MPEHGVTSFPLSPLDMLMPRFHVPKLLYFATRSEPAKIITNLRVGLALTIKAIPIIAGSVTLSEHKEDQKGSLNVQSPYWTAEDIISSNDLRDEYDYEKLRAGNFPTNVVPLEKTAPKLFAKSGDSMPVMVAQVNFLRGGLLLFFAIHHCVMDEVGLFNVMKIWSARCREETSMEIVTSQWLDRKQLMQGAGAGRLQDHPEYTLSPEEATTQATEDPGAFYPQSSDVATAVFFISDESLERLKMTATAGISDVAENSAQDIGWISTNDALMALFWCSITCARIDEGTAATTNIYPRFGMAMNGRSHLLPPMSPDYCGNVVLIAKTFTSAGNLLSPYPKNLAKAALLIRKSINVVDDDYIRDVIQLVRSTKDLGQLAPRRRPAVEHSLGCSSWARQPYYSLDWGSAMGGRCERVRWRSLKTDGLFVIFPRLVHAEEMNKLEDKKTGVEVLLGLNSKCMQRLMNDKTFKEFAEWQCS